MKFMKIRNIATEFGCHKIAKYTVGYQSMFVPVQKRLTHQFVNRNSKVDNARSKFLARRLILARQGCSGLFECSSIINTAVLEIL